MIEILRNHCVIYDAQKIGKYPRSKVYVGISISEFCIYKFEKFI